MSRRRRKHTRKSSRKHRRKQVEKPPPSGNRIVTAYRKHPRSFIGALFMSFLVVVLLITGIVNPPPFDYVRCFDTDLPNVINYDFQLFIQVGNRSGPLNVSFVRVPEDLGLTAGGTCKWPFHTLTEAVPGERGAYYTRIHVESPYAYPYSLANFFDTWGDWMGYPAPVHFSSNGVSFYEGKTTLLVHTGWADPFNDSYQGTEHRYDYGRYVPRAGDYVEIIVAEPYTEHDIPYWSYGAA